MDGASKNYLDAIPYLEKANNPRKLSIVIGNLCANFQHQGQYDKSIEYGLKSVEAALQSNDERTLGLAYLNLCVSYYDLGNLNKYFEAAVNALAHLRNASMKRDMYNTYQNISSYYLEKGDVKNAKLYADSSLQIANELSNSKYTAGAMMMQGSIATESNDFTTARKILADAKKYVDADNTWKSKADWNKMMYRLENKSGNYKSAIDFLTAEHQYYDSLANENIVEKNLVLEKKYESQKKQSQISQLEKEKIIQQLTIRQKNNYLFILIGSLADVAVIVFLYYKNNQRKEELAKQQILQLKQEKQLQAVSGIVQTQEEERSRIAKDLHDGLGSLLSGVKLSLSSMKGNQIINEEQAALFNKSIGQLDNAIGEMRRVAHNMMPLALLNFGLKEAIINLCESLNESGGVKVHFEYLNFDERLTRDQEIIIYRMIQELTNNALKHAQCSNIIVQLSKTKTLST